MLTVPLTIMLTVPLTLFLFRKLEEKAKEREGTRMEGGFTEENWEEEMAAHPFFNQQWKEGEELSPLMKVQFLLTNLKNFFKILIKRN